VNDDDASDSLKTILPWKQKENEQFQGIGIAPPDTEGRRRSRV
jgi:hypothetical protein